MSWPAALEDDVDGGEKRLDDVALAGLSESLVNGERGSGGVTPGDDNGPAIEDPTPTTPRFIGAAVGTGKRRETLWNALPPSIPSSLSNE